jgi:hypothetical protein
MDLSINILDNKEDFYNLAIEFYYNIDEEYQDSIAKIVPKSISILIDHEFIPTPCIEIRIELYHEEKTFKNSSYFLYVNQEKEFIDEFLIDNN